MAWKYNADPSTVELKEGTVYRDPVHGGLHEIVTVDEETDTLRVCSWGDEQTDDTWGDERGRCEYSLERECDEFCEEIAISEIIEEA